MKKDNDIVEMDAMDVVEWEQGQHTPRAPDAIAELARQTSSPAKSTPIPKLPTAKNTTQRTPRVTVPTPPAMQQKLEEASVVKTMPVRPTPPPGQYEELVDTGWGDEPAAAKPKIEPYTAPAIARTATPNTFRRDATGTRPKVEPAKDEGKTPVIGVPIEAGAAKTPPNGAKSAAIAQADARRPNPTPPRASTMIGVPPVRTSEPAILPPPPSNYEDWDGLAPSKPSPVKAKVDYPDDPDKEPSVIIDLNAAPAPVREPKKRAQSQPAIQTSEQGTTASGVFVMPTAAAPNATSIAENKQPISNPTHLEDRAAANRQPISRPVEDDDDLAVPLAPPARDSKPVLNPSAMLRTTQPGHASAARPGDATAAASSATALRTTQQGHADAASNSAISHGAGSAEISARSNGPAEISAKSNGSAEISAKSNGGNAAMPAKSNGGVAAGSARANDADAAEISAQSSGAGFAEISAKSIGGIAAVSAKSNGGNAAVSAKSNGGSPAEISAKSNGAEAFEISAKSNGTGPGEISAKSNAGNAAVSTISSGANAAEISAKSNGTSPGEISAKSNAGSPAEISAKSNAGNATVSARSSGANAAEISAKSNGDSPAEISAKSNGGSAPATSAKPNPRAKGTNSEANRGNGAPPPRRSKRSTAASEDAAGKIQPAPVAPSAQTSSPQTSNAQASNAQALNARNAAAPFEPDAFAPAPLAPPPPSPLAHAASSSVVPASVVPASIVRTPTPYPGFQLPTAAPDAGTQVAARAYVDPIDPAHEELSLDDASENVDEIDAGIDSGRTIEPVVQQPHPGMAFKIDGNRPSFQAYPSASAYLQEAPVRDSGWQPIPDEDVAPVAKPRDKRKLILLAGIAAVAVIAIAIMTRGGGSADKPAGSTDKQVVAVVETPASQPAAAPSAAATAPTTAALTEPAPTEPAPTEATPPTASTTPPTPTPAPRPAYRRAAKPAKPLVLDYDKPKSEPPPPSDTPDQALAKARAAYARGNQHLFAGEAESAVTQYKQALAVYPGYVAGYRGLGLAYAQQGDAAAALKAFKTYVGLVPNAKDISLIKKRIARLSEK